MKIAIDCRMLGTGGIGTYFESLLPYFLNDFECLLFGNKTQIMQCIKNQNHKIVILDCSVPCFSPKEFVGFPKSLLQKINECNYYYSPYCNIPNGIKIPVFSTIHDVVFLDIPGLTSKAGVFIRKYFYQRAINKSQKIYTVSNFSAQRIKANLNLKNKEIKVTYNSVPEWFINVKTKKVKKEDSILFVGNIKKHKGLRTLLNAFEILNKTKPELKLIIVGNADNFRTGDNEIPSLIEKFPKDKIQFTGKISNEELKQYYQTCKLLVQPSLYEGFGMPPLEALTSGTNVVISDIPVFKEIYKNLPVTFFECENAKDLAQKIEKSLTLKQPQITSNIYSFQKTYSIIKEDLK